MLVEELRGDRSRGRGPGRQRLRDRDAAGQRRRRAGRSASSPIWTRARTRRARGVEPIVHRDYDGGPIELPERRHGARPGRAAASWASASATTSSRPAATRCWAPTTRRASPRSSPPSRTSPRTPSCRGRRSGSASRPTRRSARAPRSSTSRASAPRAPTRSTAPSIGELQDETFTAAAVTIRIEGVDVHPGFATGQLVTPGASPRASSRRCRRTG